jgi:hypothetical protein
MSLQQSQLNRRYHGQLALGAPACNSVVVALKLTIF